MTKKDDKSKIENKTESKENKRVSKTLELTGKSEYLMVVPDNATPKGFTLAHFKKGKPKKIFIPPEGQEAVEKALETGWFEEIK